jgi:hypothetical protein
MACPDEARLKGERSLEAAGVEREFGAIVN